MDYKNLKLREITFLDLTEDVKIIDEIVGDAEIFIESLNEETRYISFIKYAEYIDDKKLIELVNEEFAKEHDAFFNE